MSDVVVVGAGGHAKVIIDLLRSSGHRVIGCTSAEGSGTVNGTPILGEDVILPRLRDDGIRHAFVALGDNRLRLRVGAKVREMGFELVNAVGRSAVISPSVTLGTGCAIMEGAIVNADSHIGSLAIVNTNASIDHDGRLADGVHVAPGGALAGCVSVGEGAFLGTGVRVIPRVSIGDYATIGAGAVVIRDVPAHTLCVGVPARTPHTKS